MSADRGQSAVLERGLYRDGNAALEKDPLFVAAGIAVEPERYEFRQESTWNFQLGGFGVGRRDFFKLMGCGVAVFLIARAGAAQESGGSAAARGGRSQGGGFRGEELPSEISAWLHIGETGAVTVYTGKVEMGQNIRTSLTQAVAEELSVEPGRVSMVMGDTDLVPWDMGTFGSRTTPTMNPELRRVASVARDVMVGLAARTWNVDGKRLVAVDGRVRDRDTGRSIEYARLAQDQAFAKAVVENDPLTPAADWRIAGQPLPKVDGRDFVTGRHQYTPDVILPAMLHGKVLRPPSFGAELVSADLSAARGMPGVIAVQDGSFVGVAAPSLEVAARALAAIKADWREPAQETPGRAPGGSETAPGSAPAAGGASSANLFEYLKAHQQSGGGEGYGSRPGGETGSVEQGLASAAHRLDAVYNVAYIAHTPLEPRAAVAEWKDGKVTVHTGSQRPFAVRDEVAGAFHLPANRVRVIIPDTGAAYGGKHTGEAAVEAARLARAASAPVKLVWTREEEFTWAYFRPAGVIEIKAGVDAGGALAAWEFHNYNSGGAGIGTPYRVANQRIQFHECDSPLRQGSYRGLAATANHFARECHMDDLAHAAGIDPLAFRYKNLDDERLRAVFAAAAEKFGWAGGKPRAGHGFGVAGGFEKGGYIATCAEVSVDKTSGAVRVLRVVTAFDCGAVVNPNGLRNQIMGANVMGLGGALFESIQFGKGRILNAHFAEYRVPRFSDVPSIEVVLVNRKDQPSAGAGETPLIGLAPAIGNAVFAASGVRLRSLPMLPTGRLPVA
jgi:CO/xanthine dehydrogenase Mo-binding subunit